MTEWDLVKGLFGAANLGDQGEVAAIVLRSDFDGKTQAQDAALNAFLVTEDNVSVNLEAAKKLASLNKSDDWGFSAAFRHEFIRQTLGEIERDSLRN